MNCLNDNEVKFDRNGDLIRSYSKNDNVQINSVNQNVSVLFIYDANDGKNERRIVNSVRKCKLAYSITIINKLNAMIKFNNKYFPFNI